ANGVGRAGPDRSRHGRTSGSAARGPLACTNPEPRWHMGREPVHRNRLPLRFLSPLPLLPDLLSLDGARPVASSSSQAKDGLMRFPLSLTTARTGYLLKQNLSGRKQFPLVLMLEPLHACNLTCTGCGRIREYAMTIREKLSVDDCLASADECG